MRMQLLVVVAVAGANFLPFNLKVSAAVPQNSEKAGSIPVRQGKPVTPEEKTCQTKEDVLQVLKETRIKVLRTVKGMPLTDVFDVLREEARCRINFHLRLLDGDVRVKNPFAASDISLMEALKLVCDANDYRFEIHDNIVLIRHVRGDRYEWVRLENSPLAQELMMIRISEMSFKPPATIWDAVGFFNRQLKINGGHGVFEGRIEAGRALPVLPTITLHDCTMLNALDLVCQSVDFTFRVKDRSVQVMSKTLATKDAKNQEMERAGTSRISKAKRRSFLDSNPWNSMRKTALGLFPGWCMSQSLRNRLPKIIPSLSKIGYIEREDWRADVLGTVGDGTLIETVSPRKIGADAELRFWVMGMPGNRIFVKSRNQILATRNLENSAWTEVVVSLAEYKWKTIPLALGVEEALGGDANLLWSGIELK